MLIPVQCTRSILPTSLLLINSDGILTLCRARTRELLQQETAVERKEKAVKCTRKAKDIALNNC